MSKGKIATEIARILVNKQDNFTWDTWYEKDEDDNLFVTVYDDATHAAVAKYEVHVNLLEVGR